MDQKETQFNVHPKKFTFWLFLVTVTMLFAAFTSAYVVRRAEGHWYTFELPQIFNWSALIVIIGSVLMQWAYQAAKKDKLGTTQTALVLTFLTGIGFLVNQIFAWLSMVDQGIYYVGNPSESFTYVISIMHAVHVIAALILLGVTTAKAYRYQVHSKNLLTINLCTTFWHFLAALWLYLFVFLSFLR